MIMPKIDSLTGKKVLVVDDEPDIVGSLEDLLDMCEVKTATTFEKGKRLLQSQRFDIAILDIMGVDGYRLLEIANQRRIPAVMLTAHALTPDNLMRSFKEGAASYIPKEQIAGIADYLVEVLNDLEKGKNPWERWQEKLPSSYFERRWGLAWKGASQQFWETFRAAVKARSRGSTAGRKKD
jgi:DNA-binding NtrC family response regulator